MSEVIRGEAELKRALARLKVAGPIAGERAAEAISDQVYEDAQQHVAVLTGATRDTITKTDRGVEASDAALFLEYGTVHMGAQPFMRPAADGAAVAVPKAAAEAREVILGVV